VNREIDGLEWLREVRKKMAANCHNDPKMMGDYFRRIQKQYKESIIKNPNVQRA
jgi:hypothetical protein